MKFLANNKDHGLGQNLPMLLAITVFWSDGTIVNADWPALHGNSQHTGLTAEAPHPPYRLAWACTFQNERLGTAMEPIVADNKVFVATHNGNLYALDANDGHALWRFQAHGAFLQSPAFSEGLVVAGSTDGNLYAIEAETGKMAWACFGETGGFAASPVIDGRSVFIGSRAGTFFAVSLQTGKKIWQHSVLAPIRQTAGVAEGRVYVTSEDLHVQCLEASSGALVWTSEQLTGQTVRDYYPVVVKAGGRTLVIVRTNPVLSMGDQIGRDRNLLCQNAGIDASNWQKLEAWIKSPQSRGTPELWASEQKAIINYQAEHREARTFFVLDAATGKEAFVPPVLWVAGCQGVGAMPALTSDGRLLVFYRSAYGNWNMGVAPLVGLGLLDLAENRITPLEHQYGRQPAWNTFWGTADESQNFTIASGSILIVHQGTLSAFDLAANRLFTIWGQRDTYGGFRTPPWARNEWHGPGRGSVAVSGNHLYWLTGSRVLCLTEGQPGQTVGETVIDSASVPTQKAPPIAPLTSSQLQTQLDQTVQQLLSQTWAPLFVEPGLSGCDFSFDESCEFFEALAWAWPHLTGQRQQLVKIFLAQEWTNHPPFAQPALSLKEGARREYFWTPAEELSRLSQDKPPHVFGNTYAIWLYAERCGEWQRVLAAWPQIKAAFDNFTHAGWRLNADKGDLYANRYLASLIAFGAIARKAGETESAQRAQSLADQTAEALAGWWKRAAATGTLARFQGAGELDPFIVKGDAISFQVAPHRHKVALFRDLTPEVAHLVRANAPEAVAGVWATFQTLYLTWPLAGEERQVHFGENFIDPPDLALSAFKALAWLQAAPPEQLARSIDLPFCRADLDYLTKLALTLEHQPGH